MYKFKPEDAERFAEEQGIRARADRGQLLFEKCPYCGQTTNKKEKFAISLRTGQFCCLRASCGVKGNMLTLAKDFNFSLGRDVDAYYEIGPQKQYRIFKKPDQIEPDDAALRFFESRKISPEITTKYQITSKEDGTIVFPFLDENADLQFIKYRNPRPKEGQSKEWAEKNCKPILFGMAQCNLINKTLIITEGQIDSLSVAQAGFENAVSVPTGANGFTWVPYCWNWMHQFEKLIVFGDHENGHITLYNELADRFGNVWHVREEDYLDCKDANEILQKYGADQIKRCIENAEQKPIARAISLNKIESINPYDLEKLPTGINNIDELLCGGLPFGQLVLLTGKAGDGKSTFASQLMLSAVQHGYKAFAYSGELPNYMFKSWMDFQAAGSKNTVEIWGKWTYDKPRKVKDKIQDKINKWYDGKMWLYDNSVFDLEGEEDFTTLLEELISRYGVRVILIDNLMTALDLEKGLGVDKYDRQSMFIKKMTRLALQYNVLIILIAHKRKENGYTEVNESISGSLDIVNLASIVLSYERPKKAQIEDGTADKDDRFLKVTKNRLFGKIDNFGFLLKYDPWSKRIYSNNFEKDREYDWNMINDKPVIETAPWEE